MKISAILIVSILFSLAFAAHFTGTYQDSSGNTLVIQQGADGLMKGFMGGGNLQLQLQGQGNEQGAQGVLIGPQGQLAFQAQLSPDGSTLQLTIMPMGPDGKPSQQGAQQLSFQRTSNTPQPISPAPNPPSGPVPTPNPPQNVPAPVPVPTPNPNNPPSNPLGQSDGWSGVYSGDAGKLTVVIQASAGVYGGFIEASGTRYPLQAQGDESMLRGSFQSSGGNFEFSLRRDQNLFYLFSGDTEYVLEKQATPANVNAPVNPLSNP